MFKPINHKTVEKIQEALSKFITVTNRINIPSAARKM